MGIGLTGAARLPFGKAVIGWLQVLCPTPGNGFGGLKFRRFLSKRALKQPETI
jgi:hypothetical protein